MTLRLLREFDRNVDVRGRLGFRGRGRPKKKIGGLRQ